jgi:ribosomal protein S18 acetylase RimI-like enzyme
LKELSSQNITKTAANHSNRQLVADILTQAFADDPLLNWFANPSGARPGAIRKLLTMIADVSVSAAETYVTADRNGVVIWEPPGKQIISFIQGPLMPIKLMQVVGMRHIKKITEFLLYIESQRPRDPHMHLSFIGVRPESQRHGLGGLLLEPMLQHCATNGLPVYLENSQEKNLSFYEKRGFEITKEWQCRGARPTVWLMIKHP